MSSIYERITSVTEIIDVVYQWDCGWWYDFDVSGKTDEEKQHLLDTNVLYKKSDNKGEVEV